MRITRILAEVMCEFRHAFSVITKSSGPSADGSSMPMARQRLAAVMYRSPRLIRQPAPVMSPRQSPRGGFPRRYAGRLTWRPAGPGVLR